MNDFAWILGQDTERTIQLTAWVGGTPIGDLPFLLLSPTGNGAAAKMRLVADALTLGPAVGADPLEVAPDVVHMYRDGARIALQLLGGVIHCDGHPDIWTAARIGQAMLIIGLDAWTGREQDLDSYLRRAHRIRLGLIRVLPDMR